MKNICILILVCMFLGACRNDEISDPYPKSSSYINSYLTKPENCQVSIEKNGEGLLLKILIEGNIIMYPEYDFKELAEYYHDINFNSNNYLPTNVHVFSDSIMKINISCNNDYNMNYKKDELLNNITSIRYNSYEYFIDNGYNSSSTTEFNLSLSSFNIQSRKLVNSYFELLLNELPTSSERYSFTITIDYKNESFRIITE